MHAEKPNTPISPLAKPMENTTKPLQPHLKSSENSAHAAGLNIHFSYQIF
jgi:hypothetical protein